MTVQHPEEGGKHIQRFNLAIKKKTDLHPLNSVSNPIKPPQRPKQPIHTPPYRPCNLHCLTRSSIPTPTPTPSHAITRHPSHSPHQTSHRTTLPDPSSSTHHAAISRRELPFLYLKQSHPHPHTPLRPHPHPHHHHPPSSRSHRICSRGGDAVTVAKYPELESTAPPRPRGCLA